MSDTYGTVYRALALLLTLLDVLLESTRVKRLDQLEAAKQLSGHRHDGAPIVELATVLVEVLVSIEQCFLTSSSTHVWRREHSDQDSVSKELVSILDHHVRSTDQVHVVLR